MLKKQVGTCMFLSLYYFVLCRWLQNENRLFNFKWITLFLLIFASTNFHDFRDFKIIAKFSTCEENIARNLNTQKLIPYDNLYQKNKKFKNIFSSCFLLEPFIGLLFRPCKSAKTSSTVQSPKFPFAGTL